MVTTAVLFDPGLLSSGLVLTMQEAADDVCREPVCFCVQRLAVK